MPDTPLPGSIPTLPQCLAHSGLVERVEGLARSLVAMERRSIQRALDGDGDVADLAKKLEAAERRLITVAGEDGDRGRLGDVEARLARLEDHDAERRKAATWLAVKLAAAAISAGGLAVPAGQLLMRLF